MLRVFYHKKKILKKKKENHRIQKEVAQHLSSIEGKEPSTQNFIFSKNILQEWRVNQDILRCKKTKKFCQQIYLKRMAKRRSLNRKEMIKEGMVEHPEGRKNMVCKNMGKYSII